MYIILIVIMLFILVWLDKKLKLIYDPIFNITGSTTTLPLEVVHDKLANCIQRKRQSDLVIGKIDLKKLNYNKTPRLFANALTNAVKNYPAIWCSQHIHYLRYKYRCLIWYALGNNSAITIWNWKHVGRKYVRVRWICWH